MQVTNTTLSSAKNTQVNSSHSPVKQTPAKTEALNPNPASEVQISSAARNKEQLPRYLQPAEGYPNPHARFGNTYDYLKASDQKVLREAYDYAVDNGTSLETVNEAAWYLAIQRHQETKEAAGTQFAFHVSDESIPFILAKPENRAEELEKIAADFEPTFLNRLQRAEAGDFFGTDNPHLNQELFIDAVDQSLGPYRSDKVPADRPLTMPNAPTDPESLLLNNLSGSDKSSLSKAYQNAKENNLDPEEVRKAALLLAVERMNENMSKSFSDDNSTAANAVKASSNMYQSIVDTPDKLKVP